MPVWFARVRPCSPVVKQHSPCAANRGMWNREHKRNDPEPFSSCECPVVPNVHAVVEDMMENLCDSRNVSTSVVLRENRQHHARHPFQIKIPLTYLNRNQPEVPAPD